MDQAEQLDALTGELVPRAEQVSLAARHERFTGRAAEKRLQADAACAWLRDEYPRLARLIVEGLHQCRAAESSLNMLEHEWSEARRITPALTGLDDIGLAAIERPRVPVAGVGHVPPSLAVQLPAGPGGLPAFWWPQTLYGRPRAPGF